MKLHRVILLFILILINLPLLAQTKEIQFKHLSLKEGLSQSTVLAILQDKEGFMWFGTQDGLNKYDSYQFTVYRHNPQEAHSLSKNEIFTLYEDSQGILWIGTNGGLNQFDRLKDRFIRYLHDPQNPNSLSSDTIWSIYEDNTGNLWIGTDGGGLNQFDRQTNQFIHYQHDSNNPNSLSHSSVWPIFQDKAGTLWVGTDGGGLNKFDPLKKQFVHYLPNVQADSLCNIITSIYEDNTGILWIGTMGGIYQFDRQKEIFIPYIHDPENSRTLSNNAVWDIQEDNLGNLWIATDGGGLNQFDRKTQSFVHVKHDPKNPNSLNDNATLSLYQDKAGTMWVGTGGGGVNQFNQQLQKFTHYKPDPQNPNSLNNHFVYAIYEDYQGALWVGTQGGGLNKFDVERQNVTHYLHDPQNPHSLSYNEIESLYEDSENTLWIGTFGGGLNRFDREHNRFISYQNDENNPFSLSNNHVFSIYEDHTKTLWIGTRKGLERFDRQTNTFFHYTHDPNDPESLSNNFVSTIYEDKNGTLWIGTFEGLNRFDRQRQKFIRYQHDDKNPTSLSHHEVLSIYEDQNSHLWIGTLGGGLNKFDRNTETFTHYRETDGLANDVIYGILEDESGNLWLSSNKGLSKFNPKTETFRHYDVFDGLQSNEFNKAYHKNRRGEFFFGGINGFNAFYPEQVKDNTYIPPIKMTDFEIFNQPVPLGGDSPLQQHINLTTEITLSYQQSFFAFEFAALNFLQPSKNQHAYKLEGFDKRWNQIGTRRNAYYTNVPQGTYHFRVKGSNNDDIWNEQGTTIKITVLPPPWKTWWAYSLYIITIWAIIVSYLWRQRQKLLAKQQELEREKAIAAQLKEADRLKDEFLANTSHELRTPLNGIIGIAESLIEGATGQLSQKTNANLGMIVSSGRRLLNLVNDILDFSHLKQKEIHLQLKTIDMRTIAEVVLTLSKPLIGHKKVEIINNIPTDLPPINADEDRIQQILYNLVGNAIKFTDSGAITVSAEIPADEPKKWLAITVSDTGIGIPAEKLDRIFEAFEQADGSTARIYGGTGLGLAVTQQLVKLHGGQMRVQSQVGVGSQFTFTLPLQLSVTSYQLSENQLSENQLSIINYQLSDKKQSVHNQLSTLGSEIVKEPEFGINVAHEEKFSEIIVKASGNRPSLLKPFLKAETEITENKLLLKKKFNLPDCQFHILIVDDEPVNRQVLVNYLSLQKNYRLTEAASGIEALAFLNKQSKPDLILLDIMMPHISGYEVTQKIREICPADELPIILLTAKNQVADLVAGLESGANDYLTKPISKDELLARIKTHLSILQLKAENLQAAKENERKLRQILESMPIGVGILDANGNPYYVNKKGKKILGQGVADIETEQIAEVYKIYYASTNKPYASKDMPIVKALQGKSFNTDDMEVHHPERIIPLETWATPIFDDKGHIIYALSAFQDITERKQAEQLQKEYHQTLKHEVAEKTKELRQSESQLRHAKEAAESANHAKSRFLATMSHELRTPLNGILGYAQILKRDASLTQHQQDGLNIIERSGNHLLTLINDVLDLAKIEAGKTEINPNDFNLPAFITEMTEIVRIRAQHKDIFFNYQAFNFITNESEESLPTGVHGDDKRLRQVLINLLGNAIKFTDKGGVTLKVGIVKERKKEKGERNLIFEKEELGGIFTKIRFQIEDTGVGMTESDLKDIFKPFQQVGDKQRQAQGTGLGLAISRHLVELMGGQLQITSVAGQGTTFWFDLELPEVINFSQKAKTTPSQKIIGLKDRSPILLIVDDKVENRNLLVDLLEPLGFVIIQASDGQEALSKAIKYQPHAIITDLIMPEMDGFELTRQIRQSQIIKEKIVIATSASVFEEDYQKSLQAGCNAFLPKPLQTEQLFEALQQNLGIEWIYEEAQSQDNHQAELPLVLPPSEKLTEFFELAMSGDIEAVGEQAKQLAQSDERFTPFAAKLYHFVERFQVDKMCDWLESFL
jgi:two-component system, sensor histidine kinase ChiS